jgi:hypothetical protein
MSALQASVATTKDWAPAPVSAVQEPKLGRSTIQRTAVSSLRVQVETEEAG